MPWEKRPILMSSKVELITQEGIDVIKQEIWELDDKINGVIKEKLSQGRQKSNLEEVDHLSEKMVGLQERKRVLETKLRSCVVMTKEQEIEAGIGCTFDIMLDEDMITIQIVDSAMKDPSNGSICFNTPLGKQLRESLSNGVFEGEFVADNKSLHRFKILNIKPKE